MAELSAKPTEYAGYLFRSRLEARWAAFFDLLDIPWAYEPFDLAGYIPDFVLPYSNLLVEVKPVMDAHDPVVRLAHDKIRASGWTDRAVVVGGHWWLHTTGPVAPGHVFGVAGLADGTDLALWADRGGVPSVVLSGGDATDLLGSLPYGDLTSRNPLKPEQKVQLARQWAGAHRATRWEGS